MINRAVSTEMRTGITTLRNLRVAPWFPLGIRYHPFSFLRKSPRTRVAHKWHSANTRTDCQLYRECIWEVVALFIQNDPLRVIRAISNRWTKELSQESVIFQSALLSPSVCTAKTDGIFHCRERFTRCKVLRSKLRCENYTRKDIKNIFLNIRRETKKFGIRSLKNPHFYT